MKRLLRIGGVIAYLVVGVGPVGAAQTTIDFTAFPATPQSSWTDNGVTFTPFEGGQLQLVTPAGNPAITGVIDNQGRFPALQAEIASGATFVSVLLGKGTWGGEPVFLEIYDAADSKLGESTDTLTLGGSGTLLLSVNAPPGECIAYAVFGANDPTTGSSVYADDFTFEPCSSCPVIPAPGAILLGLIGAGLVGRLRQCATL